MAQPTAFAQRPAHVAHAGSSGWESTPLKYKLLLRVHSCTGLNVTAAQGVYCKLYVGESEMTGGSQSLLGGILPNEKDDVKPALRTYRTNVHSRSATNPVWNEKFQINVSRPEREFLTIRVKSQHAFFTPCVGSVVVPLRNVRCDESQDEWFDLTKSGKTCGRIRLQLMLTRVETEEEKQRRLAAADVSAARDNNQAADRAIERLLQRKKEQGEIRGGPSAAPGAARAAAASGTPEQLLARPTASERFSMMQATPSDRWSQLDGAGKAGQWSRDSSLDLGANAFGRGPSMDSGASFGPGGGADAGAGARDRFREMDEMRAQERLFAGGGGGGGSDRWQQMDRQSQQHLPPWEREQSIDARPPFDRFRELDEQLERPTSEAGKSDRWQQMDQQQQQQTDWIRQGSSGQELGGPQPDRFREMEQHLPRPSHDSNGSDRWQQLDQQRQGSGHDLGRPQPDRFRELDQQLLRPSNDSSVSDRWQEMDKQRQTASHDLGRAQPDRFREVDQQLERPSSETGMSDRWEQLEQVRQTGWNHQSSSGRELGGPQPDRFHDLDQQLQRPSHDSNGSDRWQQLDQQRQGSGHDLGRPQRDRFSDQQLERPASEASMSDRWQQMDQQRPSGWNHQGSASHDLGRGQPARFREMDLQQAQMGNGPVAHSRWQQMDEQHERESTAVPLDRFREMEQRQYAVDERDRFDRSRDTEVTPSDWLEMERERLRAVGRKQSNAELPRYIPPPSESERSWGAAPSQSSTAGSDPSVPKKKPSRHGTRSRGGMAAMMLAAEDGGEDDDPAMAIIRRMAAQMENVKVGDDGSPVDVDPYPRHTKRQDEHVAHTTRSNVSNDSHRSSVYSDSHRMPQVDPGRRDYTPMASFDRDANGGNSVYTPAAAPEPPRRDYSAVPSFEDDERFGSAMPPPYPGPEPTRLDYNATPSFDVNVGRSMTAPPPPAYSEPAEHLSRGHDSTSSFDFDRDLNLGGAMAAPPPAYTDVVDPMARDCNNSSSSFDFDRDLNGTGAAYTAHPPLPPQTAPRREYNPMSSFDNEVNMDELMASKPPPATVAAAPARPPVPVRASVNSSSLFNNATPITNTQRRTHDLLQQINSAAHDELPSDSDSDSDDDSDGFSGFRARGLQAGGKGIGVGAGTSSHPSNQLAEYDTQHSASSDRSRNSSHSHLSNRPPSSFDVNAFDRGRSNNEEHQPPGYHQYSSKRDEFNQLGHPLFGRYEQLHKQEQPQDTATRPSETFYL